MADGKWMFGATSKADLNQDLNAKKTYLNRDLPTEYSEGGMNIGQSGENTRRTGAAAYKAQLDRDRSTCASDGLPDARKRNAYDLQTRSPRARPQEEEDHPLGRSSMGALGVPSSFQPSPSKSAQAQERRDELQKDRFDIITTIEKEGLTQNTPAARNNLDLLVGVPLTGRTDDGFLEIGASASEENSVKKQKALDYAAALRADEDNSAGSNKPVNKYVTGSRAGYNNMYTDPSQGAINTGITSLGVGAGPSLDMSQSMKQISFDVKREKQAAYRSQLANQQAVTANFKSVEASKDATSVFEDLPYLSAPSK